MVRARGLSVARRSDDGPLPVDTEVWIGDSMGELSAYYLAADVAYVGGSVVPLGGQNLIEAAAAGCPILIGPHTFNFAAASDDAVAVGAALRVDDYDALVVGRHRTRARCRATHDDARGGPRLRRRASRRDGADRRCDRRARRGVVTRATDDREERA